MEEYLRITLQQTRYHTLEDWYTESKQPIKAQDALERGVARGDSNSIIRRAKYVRCGAFA